VLVFRRDAIVQRRLVVWHDDNASKLATYSISILLLYYFRLFVGGCRAPYLTIMKT